MRVRKSQFCAEYDTSVTYEKVVSKITNSCARQAVVVIIIVVYTYKFEQWHISSVNYKENLINIKTHLFYIWFAINELIFFNEHIFLKGKNVALIYGKLKLGR